MTLTIGKELLLDCYNLSLAAPFSRSPTLVLNQIVFVDAVLEAVRDFQWLRSD